jgi:hypothetical protein
MKKIFFATPIICLLIIASCRKSNNAGGSWTFEGVSYGAASAVLTDTALVATSGTATNQGSTLTFIFPTIPTRSGSYQVVNYTTPLDSTQLYIRFINSSTSFYYFSTGNDNVTAKVTVSVSGHVSVSVPPVYLESYANPLMDSAQLTATIN